MEGPSLSEVRSRLLAWFDRGHRDLPWRRTRDPYRILLAEYLLQRTRVVSSIPYYERFLERFPDLGALAAAAEEDVLRAWEGLGFYRRAKNLHRAAKAIVEEHGGRIPETAAELETLPGIGAYTAGAVASIAFGEPVPAVDGNVTRVLTRLYRIEADVARGPGREEVRSRARSVITAHRPGAFNQALMELGATVCTPASPNCGVCPLASVCLARAAGVQGSLPRKARPRKPTAIPVAFAHLESRGRVLLVRRPDSGLLSGLWSLPGGELDSHSDVGPTLRALVESQTGIRIHVGNPTAPVGHTFSHRRWTGAIYACRLEGRGALHGSARWATPDEALRLPIVPFHRAFLARAAARTRPQASRESKQVRPS